MCKSILSPKTEIRQTSLNGKGTFAKEDIKKGEMIYIRGGELMRKEEAFNYKLNECPDGLWPITEEFWLGARNEDFKDPKVYVNHSCNPNSGLRGEITCVAIRDIKSGEEITQDYGLLDDNDYELECTCGSENCRKIITGRDWKLKELQDKYYDYFAPYLKAKIKKEVKD
jgi:SET domain-containing protein